MSLSKEDREQRRAPLHAAVARYVRRAPAVFHVPGHRQGRAAPGALRRLIGPGLRADLTEAPGLDDLHAPAGAIERAHRLLARAFGAGASFFLVGGTTAGIQALLLAAGPPGSRVVVPRHSHRSVLAGLVLAGHEPVYVRPTYDPDLDLPLGVPPAALDQALAACPGAVAVLAVHPTYHGVPAQVAELAAVAHRHGVPLLVDEAHGAHFAFHPALPEAALAAGADASVQSLHKTGGSLTQSSVLHLAAGSPLPPDRVRELLALVQSSSPSYLLMVSLDLARRDLALYGRARWERALETAARVRRAVGRIRGLRVPEIPGADPTRILVDVRGRKLSGPQAARALWRRGVAVELAGPGYVLLVLGPGTGRDDVARLLAALADLPEGRRAPERLGEPPWPQVALPPREALLGPRRRVPLRDARGQVAAEAVIPYPPGIPAVAPGEVLTPEVLEYLARLRRAGAHLQGASDPRLESVAVVDQGHAWRPGS